MVNSFRSRAPNFHVFLFARLRGDVRRSIHTHRFNLCSAKRKRYRIFVPRGPKRQPSAKRQRPGETTRSRKRKKTKEQRLTSLHPSCTPESGRDIPGGRTRHSPRQTASGSCPVNKSSCSQPQISVVALLPTPGRSGPGVSDSKRCIRHSHHDRFVRWVGLVAMVLPRWKGVAAGARAGRRSACWTATTGGGVLQRGSSDRQVG